MGSEDLINDTIPSEFTPSEQVEKSRTTAKPGLDTISLKEPVCSIGFTGATDNDSRHSGLSKATKRQEILVLLALNILLPTVDVFSDLILLVQLFINGHPRYGIMMLIPFLLSYMLSLVAWYNLDKMKHLTWIFAMVNVYPQYCAARVIHLLCWGDNKKAMVEKRLYEREISEIEVFAEAVISTFVVVYLMVTALRVEALAYVSNEDLAKHILIVGDKYSYEYYKFFVAFSSSLISASLGMAKILKVGSCRILGDGEHWKFLLLLLNMTVMVVGKALILATMFCLWEEDSVFYPLSSKIAFLVSSQLLPGLLLALLTLCHHKGSIKTILRHPSFLLLPVFSYFTFSGNSYCFSRRNQKEIRVMFNRKATLANIGLSFMGLIVLMVAALSDDPLSRGYCWPTDDPCTAKIYVSTNPSEYPFINLMLILSAAMTVLGMLLTIMFLFLDSCSPSSHTQNGAFLPSDPLTEWVVDRKGKARIV